MTALLGPAHPPYLHVMSLNVRRRLTWTTAKDRWARRRVALHALLRKEQPTILGAQEVLPDQADAILGALGDNYRMIGHGRGTNGRGEATPIAYDADRLELVSWDQRALSDRPTDPGSRGWGNLFPRVVVTAQWRDRATAGEVRMLNTHLDPLSGRSRARSLDALAALAEGKSVPTILTADLNTPADWATAILGRARLHDAWDLAREHRTPAWRTFARYRAPRLGRRIDLVAVSREFEVCATGIHGDAVAGAWPSDHLPVQALVRAAAGTR